MAKFIVPNNILISALVIIALVAVSRTAGATAAAQFEFELPEEIRLMQVGPEHLLALEALHEEGRVSSESLTLAARLVDPMTPATDRESILISIGQELHASISVENSAPTIAIAGEPTFFDDAGPEDCTACSVQYALCMGGCFACAGTGPWAGLCYSLCTAACTYLYAVCIGEHCTDTGVVALDTPPRHTSWLLP